MRGLTCGTNVALDQVGLLNGYIKVLLVGELDLYVVTFTHTVDLQEDSNTVIDMDNIVTLMELDKAVKHRCLSMLQSLYHLLLASENLVLAEDNEL